MAVFTKNAAEILAPGQGFPLGGRLAIQPENCYNVLDCMPVGIEAAGTGPALGLGAPASVFGGQYTKEDPAVNQSSDLEIRNNRVARLGMLFIIFLCFTVAGFLTLYGLHCPEGENILQQGAYTLGGGMLLAGIATAAVAKGTAAPRRGSPVWMCPLLAAGITLAIYLLGYAFLGVWPLGPKTILMVDLHHQYAPLLSELRNMFTTGEGFVYNFHIGMGASFIPTFAYYLSSPFNFLLLLFPERLLPEAILLITLLKETATAAAFATCAQYIYKRRNAGIVAAGVLYALTGFMLAYSWNIMWLDVVALLPVVVLAMEYMLRTGKMYPYILTLALALFANYYMAFMLCVFLVLYMGVWLLRQRRSLAEWGRSCGRFAAGSLLGGGLTAALLIPTALALGRTSAAGGGMEPFATQFPLFDMVGRLFYGVSPTIRSGNLPNVYCGVLAVLLLPIYFGQKRIPLRRRVVYGGLLGVLVCSCTLKQWDLLWHGLHAPNDLPYRFSFLISFVMLLMTAAVLTHLEHITPRQILTSLAACAGYLILWERMGGEKNAPTPAMLYANLFLLVMYAAVLLLIAVRRVPRQAAAWLVLLAVSGELVFGTADTLMAMNRNEYFTQHADYMDNASTAANKAAIERAQALAEKELGEDFCRFEYLPRNTCMDTARHHYSGLTTFASSNPYQTTLFMGKLGYAINGVNSYLYHSFVPTVDSLLGVRYVVLANNIAGHAQLEKVDEVTVQGETRYIYRNRLALPLGFMASEELREYTGVEYAPFACQEMLFSALSGQQVSLFTMMELSADSTTAQLRSDAAIYMEGGSQSAEFSTVADADGQYFAYVDCRAAKAISIKSYTLEESNQNTWNVTPHEPYIIDMGHLQQGQKVEISLEGETAASGNIYIMRLDGDELDRQIAALREGGLQITSQSSTHLEGTVQAAQAGTLFLSIPYDQGWTVKVDGKPAETFPIARAEAEPDEKEKNDGALLGVVMPAGEHTVELTFRPRGLGLGLAISLVCLVILLVPVFVKRRRKATAPAGSGAAASVAAPQGSSEPTAAPESVSLAEKAQPDTAAAASVAAPQGSAEPTAVPESVSLAEKAQPDTAANEEPPARS